MKATLEFTLPEETSSHEDAVNGTRWKALVFEIDQALRSRSKYGPEDHIAAGAEWSRHELHRLLEDSGLSLD